MTSWCTKRSATQNLVKPGTSGSTLCLSDRIGTPNDISINATPKAKIASLAIQACPCESACDVECVDCCILFGETKLCVTYVCLTKSGTPLPYTKWISSRHHFSFNHGVACNCNTADATVSANPYLSRISLRLRDPSEKESVIISLTFLWHLNRRHPCDGARRRSRWSLELSQPPCCARSWRRDVENHGRRGSQRRLYAEAIDSIHGIDCVFWKRTETTVADLQLRNLPPMCLVYLVRRMIHA